MILNSKNSANIFLTPNVQLYSPASHLTQLSRFQTHYHVCSKKKKKRGQEHYTDGHPKGKTKTKKIRLNTKRLAACNPSGYFKNFGVLQ